MSGYGGVGSGAITLSNTIQRGIMEPDHQPTRVCRGCERELSIVCFPLTRGKRFFRCQDCISGQNKAWRDDNRQRSLEIKASWRSRNPGHRKKTYERTREESIAAAQDFKVKNREQVRSRYRESYAADKTPFLARQKRRQQRDAQVGGSFTKVDQCALWQVQAGRCANPFCGADLSLTQFHTDHIIPVALGGSHDRINRQLLCPNCNHRKGALTNKDWLAREAKRA
jgi:5-methylcytosine-specific restriction endonuclease McrA